jgi:hypothetical protein
MHAQERCLLDDAQQVMDALSEFDGAGGSVNVSDEALARPAGT